jgi:tetratricopeptide (TPR) repeat protein
MHFSFHLLRVARLTRGSLVLVLLLSSLAVAKEQSESKSTPAQAIKQKTEAIVDQLQADGDYAAAQQALSRCFDWLVLHASPNAHEAFLTLAFHRRLVAQLSDLPKAQRSALLPYLLKHPRFAYELVFLHTRHDKTKKGYRILLDLKETFGDNIAKFPGLTAALCWVHDGKYQRQINDRTVTLTDPKALFAYYTKYRNRMNFDTRTMPGRLLTWVVSTTRPVKEMQWALSRYRGTAAVGRTFFEIEYDTDYLRAGAEKDLASHAYTLPNIRKFGGVCADQAYYAMCVAQAIGVPAAYVSARGNELGHAWVGFLHRRGRRARWNFSVGRYEVYQGLRGRMEHPQTNKRVTDSRVSLLANLLRVGPGHRWVARAMVDAARRVRELRKLGDTPDVDAVQFDRPVQSVDRQKPTIDRALALLKSGVQRNPAAVAGWQQLVALARTGELSVKQKKQWVRVVDRVVPDEAPSFMLHVLRPMIETVAEPETQHQLWSKVFKRVQHKPELAAEVRMAQAQLWQDAGQRARAGKYYLYVAQRYVDAGPFAVKALRRAEAVLREMGRKEKVLALYQRAFQQVKEPEDLATPFKRQSNWYKIGITYAKKLEAAGQAKLAKQLRASLKG